MIHAPDINPVAISLGPISIHWYALSYLAAFAMAWWLGHRRAQAPDSGWTSEHVADLVFYGALGILLGGRIGYILFYNLSYYIHHPIEIIYLWRGGMAFHGAFLGSLLALWLFARHTNRSWLQVTDFVAPLVPFGLGAGRIANFINQELWGKVTDVSWGVVFKTGGPLPRHPSQLYEAFLEGLVLFIILWWYSGKPRPLGAVTAVAVTCYGLFRFSVEFVRMPDVQIGYLAGGWLTMGHILSLPMILGGAALFVWALKRTSSER